MIDELFQGIGALLLVIGPFLGTLIQGCHSAHLGRIALETSGCKLFLVVVNDAHKGYHCAVSDRAGARGRALDGTAHGRPLGRSCQYRRLGRVGPGGGGNHANPRSRKYDLKA